MRLLTALSLILLLPMLSACSGYTPEDYKNGKPKLDIRKDLNGKFIASGMIFDWKGKASRHFVVKMLETWEGNTGTLDERFTYSDGTTQTRIWKITFNDENHFTGTANDVIGEATGEQQGNALNMNYTLRNKNPDGSTIDLSVKDWIYMTQGGVMLNRTKLYKWGFPVGEVFISFAKDPS